jgi:hypothetical protein
MQKQLRDQFIESAKAAKFSEEKIKELLVQLGITQSIEKLEIDIQVNITKALEALKLSESMRLHLTLMQKVCKTHYFVN